MSEYLDDIRAACQDGVPMTYLHDIKQKDVPRFMRRRMELLGEIAALVAELDESLDRIEHATGRERHAAQ